MARRKQTPNAGNGLSPLPSGPCYTSLCGRVTLYLGDSLAIAPTLESVDAVISDPPYGMSWDTDSRRFSHPTITTGPGRDHPKIIGDTEPFDPAPWLKYPKVVLFGCNHYAERLPVGTTLVWIKRLDPAFGKFLSVAELAWMKGGYGVYAYRKCFPPASRINEAGDSVHPSLKPIEVMAWCMERAAVATGAVVLDPFMGSGTTGIAAIRTGRRFVGIEKDPVHYATALDRIQRELAQGDLFLVCNSTDHPTN